MREELIERVRVDVLCVLCFIYCIVRYITSFFARQDPPDRPILVIQKRSDDSRERGEQTNSIDETKKEEYILDSFCNICFDTSQTTRRPS